MKKSTGSGYGGCVVSIGNLTLNSVTRYRVLGEGRRSGDAAWRRRSRRGNLTLNNSIVSYSSVTGNASSAGGGVYVTGDLSVQGDSSISHNRHGCHRDEPRRRCIRRRQRDAAEQYRQPQFRHQPRRRDELRRRRVRQGQPHTRLRRFFLTQPTRAPPLEVAALMSLAI